MTKLDYSRTRLKKNGDTRPGTQTTTAPGYQWSPVTRGEYRGITLPELLVTNPARFFWGLNCPDFFSGAALHQAKLLAGRAAHILPPDGKEFCFHVSSKGYLQ